MNVYLRVAKDVAASRDCGAIYGLPPEEFWEMLETFSPPYLITEIRIDDQLMMLCFMSAING